MSLLKVNKSNLISELVTSDKKMPKFFTYRNQTHLQ